MPFAKIQQAATTVADRTGRVKHDVGLVLGSGLSGFIASLPESIEISAADLGIPEPKVEGHTGRVISADLAGVRVLALAGRVHAYEGWAMDDVVLGVRILAMSGCATVILTNAAGGMADGLEQGDLVAISDHINLTGRNPLVGPNDRRLGTRFPDMSSIYPANLRSLVKQAAANAGLSYKEGVYCWWLGPSYETPAEIRMLQAAGGSMVGMSTVPEAVALAHMGVPVIGISLVTNLAAGMTNQPLDHEEVTATAAQSRSRFESLLHALIPTLPRSR